MTADRPDGVRVRLDIASCPGDASPPVRAAAAGAALTAGQGVAVVSDPRWGFTMDAGLVDAGARLFPEVPVVAR